MFLTETPGRKEGIDGMDNTPSDTDPHDVTKLTKYLFLTEQMGWRKGLKLVEERGEDTVEDKLQQMHDMEGFQPKHWKRWKKPRAEDVLTDNCNNHTPK